MRKVAVHCCYPESQLLYTIASSACFDMQAIEERYGEGENRSIETKIFEFLIKCQPTQFAIANVIQPDPVPHSTTTLPGYKSRLNMITLASVSFTICVLALCADAHNA